MVRKVLALGVDVNGKTSSNLTPLHMATQGDNLEIFQMILQYTSPKRKDGVGRLGIGARAGASVGATAPLGVNGAS
jgi:hypothetical protein